MYNNIFLPVQNLRKTAINTGGLCWIIFFRWEDVDQWPAADPLTGILTSDIILKPSAIFYACDLTHKTKTFKETLKSSPAGPFIEISVAGNLAGNNLNHITGIAAMQFHQYGILLKERNGEQRLIGNADSGASLEWDYTSGTLDSSRIRSMKFSWESMLPAPIFQGPNIVADGQIIPINPDIPPAGNFQLLIRFKVGEGGSPMAAGDTVYTNPDMTGKNVVVFASASYLNQKPDAAQRYIIKATSSNQITFVGGVNQDEIIEIYTYL